MKNLGVLPRELEGADMFPSAAATTPMLVNANEHYSRGAGRSPARDQQLRLERDVLRSLAGRETPGVRPHGLARALIVIGVSVSGWVAAFGIASAVLG